MTNPELAKDPDAFIAHLDAQIDALIRKTAELEAESGSGAATDPTGAVTVEFGNGGILQAISVAPTWEQHIKAEELVTVITDTLIAARDGDGEAGAAVELSDEEVAQIRERELAETARSMKLDNTPEEIEEIAASLPQALDQLNAQFDAMLAKADEVAASVSDEPVEVETVTTFSENQMVGVETAGGVAVGVTIHPTWLPGKSGIAITESFKEAIENLPGGFSASQSQ